MPNIAESCFIAGAFSIPEVCIYCNSKLFRANRTYLYDPDSVEAFVSPNFSLLGVKDGRVKINWNIVRKNLMEKLVLIKNSKMILLTAS